MIKVLFNTYKDAIVCKFYQSMWSERPGMTKVLFSTYKDASELEVQCLYTRNEHINKGNFH